MIYSDALRYYQNVAQSYPPLKREEELKLLKRAKKGDPKARDLLVRHNLNLVIHLAKRHLKSGLPLEDLVQEGMGGYVHAIDKFDLKQKVKLSTYAVWWVNAFIFKYIKLNRAPVKMPHMRKGEAPIKVPLAVSWSTPIGENGDQEFGDLFADEKMEPVDALYDEKAERKTLNDALKRMRSLGAIGRDIVRERLMAEDPTTLEDLGKRHNLSRERIRQIEVGVKEKLRKSLSEYAA